MMELYFGYKAWNGRTANPPSAWCSISFGPPGTLPVNPGGFAIFFDFLNRTRLCVRTNGRRRPHAIEPPSGYAVG